MKTLHFVPIILSIALGIPSLYYIDLPSEHPLWESISSPQGKLFQVMGEEGIHLNS
jgi:hypothetical protein